MGWHQPVHLHVLRRVRVIGMGHRGTLPTPLRSIEADPPSCLSFVVRVQALEKDFDGTEQALIPDLIAKLLYALTWNRQIK